MRKERRKPSQLKAPKLSEGCSLLVIVGAAVFEMLASLCFDLVFVSQQHTVRHQRRRPDQHGGAQRSHEETSRPAGTELLKEPRCLPSIHSATETVCRLQVGHRDLEDILRDIDLNGDGHVDFEGEASRAEIQQPPQTLTLSPFSTLDFHPHGLFPRGSRLFRGASKYMANACARYPAAARLIEK